jgi:hypothetical protein
MIIRNGKIFIHYSQGTKIRIAHNEEYLLLTLCFTWSEPVEGCSLHFAIFSLAPLFQYYSRSLRSAQSRKRVPSFQYSITPILSSHQRPLRLTFGWHSRHP